MNEEILKNRPTVANLLKKWGKLPVEEQTIIYLECALETHMRFKLNVLTALWCVNEEASDMVHDRTTLHSTEEEYNQVINEVLTHFKNQL